jgi:hypothetical protein
MSASEKVSKVDEFAVGFVFNVDDAPFILAGSDHFTVNVECLFGTNDGKGDDVLFV